MRAELRGRERDLEMGEFDSDGRGQYLQRLNKMHTTLDEGDRVRPLEEPLFPRLSTCGSFLLFVSPHVNLLFWDDVPACPYFSLPSYFLGYCLPISCLSLCVSRVPVCLSFPLSAVCPSVSVSVCPYVYLCRRALPM